MNPSPELLERVQRVLGSRPVEVDRVASGGYSLAEHWTLRIDDGRRVFVKVATSDGIAESLRAERANLAALDAEFACEVVAWDEGDRPLLVLEDLSEGRWPPPWEAGDVERVLDTLGRVASTEPPGHLPDGVVYWHRSAAWPRIAADPEPFLRLQVAGRDWLAHCARDLIDAEAAAEFHGTDLVHGDLWSSNICFLDDRVVFVDWNAAFRGDRRCDIALLLPALRLEGGPLPEAVWPNLGAYAAVLSGFFARSATLPPPRDAPAVRRFQLRQLTIALPWACRELGLPTPELDWPGVEINRANADLAAGAIDEDAWYARVEEPLTDAYLSHAEPWRQSGKGGDETDWRWSRELPLQLAKDGDAILDVGCANGYLMESFHRWGAERGMRIEPYGLDISWRLASLARRRLPEWSDRVFVGNVMTWTPPRRFDIVHTALDYMPPNRGREHIDRVLADFLVPGGHVVLRPSRMPKGPDPAMELQELGLRPDGVLEAVHPTNGELRRTAYLRSPSSRQVEAT